MFTGLVEETGRVLGAKARGTGRELRIASGFRDLALGESVACDGVCLTVESFTADGAFTVAAGDETLRVTTIGDLGVGDRVHLERAMRVGDRLGGHIVQGHVDGVGVVREVVPGPQWTYIRVAVPEGLRRYLVAKGSVCMGGVSLTVNGIDAEGFHVGIIPHTLDVTKLGALRPGDRVNVEVDILAKYVERLLGGGAGGLTIDKLRSAGFV